MAATLSAWLRVSRAPFLTASLVPVVLGGALAARVGVFSWLHFVLALVGIAAVHLGTNLINEYYDYRSGSDAGNRQRTPFSGGSLAIQAGLVPAPAVWWAGVGCFGGAALSGLYLVWASGWAVLAIGAVGIAGGYWYTAPPLQLGYRGLGELATGILLGPLAVLAGYVVHTGRLAADVVWVSVPVGLLVALILYVNEFPDYEADRQAGKRHLVVILGPARSRWLYAAAMCGVYVVLAGLCYRRLLPPAGAWLFLTAPFALAAIIINWRKYKDYRAMIPAQALTILLHLVIGLGLAAAVAFG